MRTLKNAVDQGNVHHAYLFVGSRGTGKTSMAKILASALNATGGASSTFSADDPAVAGDRQRQLDGRRRDGRRLAQRRR